MGSNIGHRLGALITESEENTINRFNANIKFEGRPEWKYLEFDIVECMDNVPIVHHDRHINGRKIKDMTLIDIFGVTGWQVL